MARDRHLPHALAAVHPRFGSPYRAEIAVGVVVAVVAAVVDVRGAIGFSSFAVLRVLRDRQRVGVDAGTPGRSGARTGGCLVLAVTLPLPCGRRRRCGSPRRRGRLRCLRRVASADLEAGWTRDRTTTSSSPLTNG